MTENFDLHDCVPTFPDFPKAGVNFYDITGLFKDPEIFALTVQKMTALIKKFSPRPLVRD